MSTCLGFIFGDRVAKCGTQSLLPGQNRGIFGPSSSVSLPVFRSLIPAGVPQAKLGPNIGSTPARQNVAIYNAGDRVATATIRRVCDAGVVQARTANIASNTTVQVAGFSSGGANECTLLNYTVITVDQESLSLVT